MNQAPAGDRRVLVLIQLAGGNDGLNTLIPFRDPNYYRLRPQLAIAAKEVVPINGDLGFHPSCGGLAELSNKGKLAIIQNVSYQNPTKNHFRASEIWETASSGNEYLSTSWIDRYLDTHRQVQPLRCLCHRDRNEFEGSTRFKGQSPHLYATKGQGTERQIRRIIEYDCPRTRYPDTELARSLSAVTAMIASGLGTSFYLLSHHGYDTHRNQLGVHARLLSELSTAMAAFQRDLETRHLDHRVLTMTFSEFGRHPAENSRGGTDHGTAAPLMVMGSRMQKPLIGLAPSLDIAPHEDLSFTTDFRQVYATILDRWFYSEAQHVLRKPFAPLDFI